MASKTINRGSATRMCYPADLDVRKLGGFHDLQAGVQDEPDVDDLVPTFAGGFASLRPENKALGTQNTAVEIRWDSNRPGGTDGTPPDNATNQPHRDTGQRTQKGRSQTAPPGRPDRVTSIW